METGIISLLILIKLLLRNEIKEESYMKYFREIIKKDVEISDIYKIKTEIFKLKNSEYYNSYKLTLLFYLKRILENNSDIFYLSKSPKFKNIDNIDKLCDNIDKIKEMIKIIKSFKFNIMNQQLDKNEIISRLKLIVKYAGLNLLYEIGVTIVSNHDILFMDNEDSCYYYTMVITILENYFGRLLAIIRNYNLVKNIFEKIKDDDVIILNINKFEEIYMEY